MDQVLSDMCFKTAVRGERDHGTDGVVHCDLERQTTQWVTLAQVTPNELQSAVEELLSDDKHNYIVLLQRGLNVDDVRMRKDAFSAQLAACN